MSAYFGRHELSSCPVDKLGSSNFDEQKAVFNKSIHGYEGDRFPVSGHLL
ncbi:MAG: hypothetical protein V7K25_14950 [Nostoc sp.]